MGALTEAGFTLNSVAVWLETLHRAAPVESEKIFCIRSFSIHVGVSWS
jgi:hypothetical protein